jgi:hypothetical protein
MQVIVTPEPGGLDAFEWEQRLRELQLKLGNLSANNIPFQVKLAVG